MIADAAVAPPLSLVSSPRPRRILLAGALTGVSDILWAIVLTVSLARYPSLERLGQAIATGLIGREAAQAGGWSTASLGYAIHFCIATAWAAVYFLARRNSPWLQRLTATRQGRLAAGVVYGMLVWILMTTVVLPLSQANPTPIGSKFFWIQLVGHIPFVGLPITLTLTPTRR